MSRSSRHGRRRPRARAFPISRDVQFGADWPPIGSAGAPLGEERARLQCAALPYCRAELNEPRVLLITSKRTRRWILPKGWPRPGEPLAAAAAREAFEEAGVVGRRITEGPLGEYTYLKSVDQRLIKCRVVVFALPVSSIASGWPERGQRALRWCSPDQAAHLLGEPRLQRLLAHFDPPRRSRAQLAAVNSLTK